MPYSRPTILLTVLAAASFLPLLGRRDIVTSHEARVAQTARAMQNAGWPWDAKPAVVPAVRLGHVTDEQGSELRLLPDPAGPPLRVNPWLVPVLNDEIRLQKPPLPYWCAAVCFRLAGEWSEALARLTPALLGALATLLIYDLARRTVGRRAAAPAAFVWVTSYFVPDEFRKVMADPYLAFFTLAAVWAWVRATDVRGAPDSLSRDPKGSADALQTPPARPRSLLPFYLATALGLLSKGPPLLVHLPIALALFHALHRRRPPGRLWAHLTGIAIVAAIVLPWPLYVMAHVPHALDIWRYESVGEISDASPRSMPFWAYGPGVLLVALPWTPVLLYAAFLALRRASRTRPRRSGRRLFPLAWYAGVVLFFSFVHMKKNAYLLPAMPAQTLVIAQGLVWLAAALRKRRRVSRPTFDGTLPLTCTLLVIGIAALFNLRLAPDANARSPRAASRFIAGALSDPLGESTVIPSKLPPEATLYLPAPLAFDPRAQWVLYLLDDPRGTAEVDRDAFARRIPDLNVLAVAPVAIPNQGPQHRYKLFRLKVGPEAPRNLARGPGRSPGA